MAQKSEMDETRSLIEQKTLIPAGRWAWKEWAGVGLKSVNEALMDYSLGFSIATPTDREIQRVFDCADLTAGMLDWFQTRLSPLGWVLVALLPFDEIQAFYLIRSQDRDSVRALLRKQGQGMS